MNTPCPHCSGCGQIADSAEGEPWSAWEALPEPSKIAMRLGLVRPLPCPACRGTGRRPGERRQRSKETQR